MPSHSPSPLARSESDAAGPRAVLRVPEVLMAIAAQPAGRSLAELAPLLNVPKTSLHRLLRTLERGGYVSNASGGYQLGPISFRLASLISRAAPASPFPACARPILEKLAEASDETVMLGVVSGSEPEILYVEVIDSGAPIRFTVSIGDRRPLYCAASGKAVLAYLPPEVQRDYLQRTDFVEFTPQTSDRDALPDLLQDIARTGVSFDNGGKVTGASGIASPIFDEQGQAIASISVAGPSERILANRLQLETMTRDAAEEVSRLIGYEGSYPPLG